MLQVVLLIVESERISPLKISKMDNINGEREPWIPMALPTIGLSLAYQETPTLKLTQVTGHGLRIQALMANGYYTMIIVKELTRLKYFLKTGRCMFSIQKTASTIPILTGTRWKTQ